MADNSEGTARNAARNNRISITPLHLNLSHQEALPRVEALLAGVPEGLLGRVGDSIGSSVGNSLVTWEFVFSSPNY